MAAANLAHYLVLRRHELRSLQQRLTTTAVYENLDGSLRKLRENVRDFRLNPRKYLRLKVF